MLDIVFIGMFIGAVIFTSMTVADKKNFAWPCLAVLFLAVCAAGVVRVESGYSFMYENNADNSVRIISGLRPYDGMAPLAIVFIGLIIMVIAMMTERAFGEVRG